MPERLFIIKVGGNIIDDEAKLKSFLQSFASIQSYRILVHGGGKIATEIGNKLGIESKYINGRRITDDATIDLVTMVYGGLINKKMVAQLQSLYCNAIGLTGADGWAYATHNPSAAGKTIPKDYSSGRPVTDASSRVTRSETCPVTGSLRSRSNRSIAALVSASTTPVGLI